MGMKCVSCGEKLRWAWEAQQGDLCAACGPGSLKWQEEHNQIIGRPGISPEIQAIIEAGGSIPPGSIPPGTTIRVDVPTPKSVLEMIPKEVLEKIPKKDAK